MIVVVDASVAAMWFIPEPHSDQAAVLLGPEYELVAPDLIHLEVGSVLLQALRRDEITLADGREALGTLLPGAVRSVPSTDYAESAFDIAQRFGGSIYDAVYIALARETEAQIVTNDGRLAAIAGKADVRASLIAEGAPTPPQTRA